MVTWRGKGWTVLVFALLAIGLPLNLNGIYCGLAQLALFSVFGVALWFLGNKLNAGQNYYSQQAGKFVWKDIFEVGHFEHHDRRVLFSEDLSPSHSFSLIKVQYWLFGFILSGLVCLVISIFN